MDERTPLITDNKQPSRSVSEASVVPPQPNVTEIENTPPYPKLSNGVVLVQRKCVIEPVLILFIVANAGKLPLNQQYLYSRFGNASYISSKHSCFLNDSDPATKMMEYMQKETSKWSEYVSVCTALPIVFIVPFLGAYSDTVGRRMVLLIPSLMSLLSAILTAFVVFFELPVLTLLIASLLDGVGGSQQATMMISLSYLSDTTTLKTRAFRLTLAEGINLLSQAISQAGLGFWIESSGFLWPCVAIVGLFFVNLIYVTFFVPETLICEGNKKFSPVRQIKEINDIFKNNKAGRRTKLILLLVIIFVNLLPFNTVKGVQLLFCKNRPFCWGPIMIGVYQAGTVLVKSIMGLSGVPIFQALKVPEIWIGLIGVLSNMGGVFANAFARTDIHMYIVTLIGGLSMMAVSMFRTKISHLVYAHELGAIYALAASVDAICQLVGLAGSQFIYEKTVSFMPGLAFIVTGSLMIVAVILVVAYAFFEKNIDEQEELAKYQVANIQEDSITHSHKIEKTVAVTPKTARKNIPL